MCDVSVPSFDTIRSIHFMVVVAITAENHTALIALFIEVYSVSQEVLQIDVYIMALVSNIPKRKLLTF